MAFNNRPNAYLSEKHFKDLRGSGLTPQQAKNTGHFSADKQLAQKHLGIRLPGLIFTYTDPCGVPYIRKDGTPFYRLKPDWEGIWNHSDKEPPKYLSPSGEGSRPYFSRLYPNWNQAIRSTKVAIWETEGEKKGDCGCLNGLAVLAFPGVYGWVDKTNRTSAKKLENSRPLPELDAITWEGRRVNQCFDSDIVEKVEVQIALAERAHHLRILGASPYFVLLPNEINGSKNGLDDFVVRHGIDALKKLAEVAEPTHFKEDKNGKVQLIFKEPDSHLKSVMAWSVMKERWAFRPGIGWYEYTGTHWVLRKPEEFEQVLTQFMDAQHWKTRSNGTINSVVRELRSRLLVREEHWNSINKLAFKNGTYDAKSDAFTHIHNPEDYLTKVKPYSFLVIQFEPVWHAICPTWLNFLKEATGGNQELIDLLQAWIKYVLFPRPKDKKSVIEKSLDLFGPKGTGKGTCIDVIIALAGEENIGPAAPETFKSATGLGQLIDKDIALDADSTGFLENVGAYNKIVSNEPVEVKKLYRDSHIMRLGVVVIRAYNAFIDVPGSSEGLDRRLTVVPFRNRPKSIDPLLSEKLKAELPGIFAWAWQLSFEEMQSRILRAGFISTVAEASIDRFENNNLEYQFLREVYPNGKESIQAQSLYEAYRNWCDRNRQKPKAHRTFRPAIQALGCHRGGKSNGRYFYAIPDMEAFDVAAYLGIKSNYKVEAPESIKHKQSNSILCLDSCCDSSQDKTGQLQTESQGPNDSETEETVHQGSLFVETASNISLASNSSISQNSNSATCPQISTFAPEKYSPPLLPSDWQPAAGDLVRTKQGDSWCLARMIAIPNDHPDPKKRFSNWKICLESGEESLVWKLEDIRPVTL